MMIGNESQVNLTDLVDGTLAGPEWDQWLVEHPDAAVEVAMARRVRAFMIQLREEGIAVPADFEARLLERIRADATLLDLLDLGLAGLAHTILEILNVLFGLLPAPQAQLA
jgi:hypothetical protein